MAEHKDSKTIVDSLTELEKAALLSGATTWQTRAVENEGVKALFMSDGPHGLRKQAGPADHLGLHGSIPSTCFPTSATIANSWNLDLAKDIGVALGEEASLIGVDVILGPGLNIKRSPLGGRNFEYFSEDPYLSGWLAAAYVRGIQSQGIAACPKHYAANNQETRRMVSDSVVDETTLREIYLKGFEIAVREGDPKVVMSAYNLVNGVYANENKHLLKDILRDEWGFNGVVVTDWGGGNDEVDAIAAGSTLEMPSPGYDSVETILDDPNVDKKALAERAAEVVRLAGSIKPVETSDVNYAEHQKLAERAAADSIVMLRNEKSILPLAEDTRIALIGDLAFTPRYQGAGSSLVNPTELIGPLEAFADSPLEVVAEAKGYDRGKPADAALEQEAVEAANLADVVVLYLGLDEITESEGKDRSSLAIPQAQVELLEKIHATGKPIVVVLSAGAAISMPWLDKTDAILHGYLSGQAGAPAMVEALIGKVNPSGKLAESYAFTLEDTPTAGNFPSDQTYAYYKEGPYVGYRYYQKAEVPTLFPFGFGLSYTTFEYSDLAVEGNEVAFVVTNTGDVAGAEVAQLYLTPPAEVANLGPRPLRELAGFAKVYLEPGQSAEIVIGIEDYSTRFFDRLSDRWVKAGGTYQVSVGPNSDDLVLTGEMFVEGEDISEAVPAASIKNYVDAKVHHITTEEFGELLGRNVPPQKAPPEVLTMNSPLADLEYSKSWVGRSIYKHYFVKGLEKADRKGEPDLNLLFQYGMPFRAVYKMSGGMADKAMVEGILNIVNGHFFRGVGEVTSRFFQNKKRQKALAEKFEEEAS